MVTLNIWFHQITLINVFMSVFGYFSLSGNTIDNKPVAKLKLWAKI